MQGQAGQLGRQAHHGRRAVGRLRPRQVLGRDGTPQDLWDAMARPSVPARVSSARPFSNAATPSSSSCRRRTGTTGGRGPCCRPGPGTPPAPGPRAAPRGAAHRRRRARPRPRTAHCRRVRGAMDPQGVLPDPQGRYPDRGPHAPRRPRPANGSRLRSRDRRARQGPRTPCPRPPRPAGTRSRHEPGTRDPRPRAAASPPPPRTARPAPDLRTFVIDLARVAGFRPTQRPPLPGTAHLRPAWRTGKAGIDFIQAWENRAGTRRHQPWAREGSAAGRRELRRGGGAGASGGRPDSPQQRPARLRVPGVPCLRLNPGRQAVCFGRRLSPAVPSAVQRGVARVGRRRRGPRLPGREPSFPAGLPRGTGGPHGTGPEGPGPSGGPLKEARPTPPADAGRVAGHEAH